MITTQRNVKREPTARKPEQQIKREKDWLDRLQWGWKAKLNGSDMGLLWLADEGVNEYHIAPKDVALMLLKVSAKPDRWHGVVPTQADIIGAVKDLVSRDQLLDDRVHGRGRRAQTNYQRSGIAPQVVGPPTTLIELLAGTVTEPEFLVGGLLPLGMSVLAARPKVGKSWLALLWAIALSNGGTLNGFAVRKVPVLYLALEDTRYRFRDRSEKVLCATGFKASAELDIRLNCPRANEGGLNLVADWFHDHPGGLVVVDTLAKFRDRADKGSAYESDYAAVGDLKSLADQHDGAGLFVHHTRKAVDADDPFAEVSGTFGIIGAADSVFVLDRKRGARDAKLYATGRDIVDSTAPLTWDAAACLWTIGAPADGISRGQGETSTKVERCADWLREFVGGYSWPDADIQTAADRAGFTRDNVKGAKAELRRGTPALCSRPRGRGAAWWNWFGSQDKPSPDRPESTN